MSGLDRQHAKSALFDAFASVAKSMGNGRRAEIVDLGAYREVLVVCAHPDDESFGLGAVIAAFTAAGSRVRVLCFTRGEASTLGADASLPDRRVVELGAAALELGVDDPHVFDYPDGRLAAVPADELAAGIDTDLADTDLLLVFDEGGVTGHPDHQTATLAAVAAGRRHDIAVLAWTIPDGVASQLNAEFGTSFIGALSHDIDVVLVVDRTTQRAAMAHHASQLLDNPIPQRRIELQGDLEHLRFLHPAGERSTVRVDPEAIAAAVAHAHSAQPAEICGLIGGRDHRLEQAVPVANIAEPQPGRCGFHMDPTGQFRAIRAFEEVGLEVTGIYHSHPATSPVPSAQDIRLAVGPDTTHLIVATAGSKPTLAAWRLGDDVAQQVRLVAD